MMNDFIWPSDIDRAEHEELQRVCEYLEEVLDELDEFRSKPIVTEFMPVYVVETNTDCTEGRGYNYPIAVCENKSTALRLGKKRFIQGSDCPVHQGLAVKIDGKPSWLMPGRLERMSKEDEEAERKIEQKIAKEQLKKQVLDRAKAAGLSEEDIAILGGDHEQ